MHSDDSFRGPVQHQPTAFDCPVEEEDENWKAAAGVITGILTRFCDQGLVARNEIKFIMYKIKFNPVELRHSSR